MSCKECDEQHYVIDKLAKLLADIAIIVNGPEPPLTSWSYHDLPEKVRALKQAQQPAAAVPPAWRVPERSKLYETDADFFHAKGLADGWNECRRVMLAAAERRGE